MVNALIARFPFGVYYGHAVDGQTEPIPQLTRLFSALVNSACRGSTAEAAQEDLVPTADAITALRWLEDNPPDGLNLPALTPTTPRNVLAYRREGVFDKDGRDRVVGKLTGRGTALSGAIGWVWSQPIPADVANVLDSLCADVAYLGDSDSPVTLEVADAEVTHRATPGSPYTRDRSLPMRVPTSGRLAVLNAAYSAARPKRSPSVAADRHSMTALPAGARLPSADSTTVMRYRPLAADVSDAPWSQTLLLPVRGEIDITEAVPWCVALHRAIAARLGDAAPPVITGSYAKGVRRPANRVAIHLLDASLVAHHGVASCAFAVLVPPAIEPEDIDALLGALRGLTSVYRAGAARVAVGEASEVSASRFWAPPPPTHMRVWASVTPIVPETRPQSTAQGARWSLADAARLSVGFVARDRLKVQGRGADRYSRIAAEVSGAGVRIGNIRRVGDSRVGRYAHKLPDSVIAQPFHATLDLADLWDPRALVALGQSRHLGGGLLCPTDAPAALVSSWFER